MSKQEMSRRGFFGSTVAAVAALSALGLTGCNGNGGAEKEEITWDKETDVVVIGFGGAGASAAIAAAEAGASVIALEKGDRRLAGGNTSVSGGGSCVGKPENVDGLFQFVKAQMPKSGIITDEEIRDYCEVACGNEQWLLDHGAVLNKTDFKGGPGSGAMYASWPTAKYCDVYYNIGGAGSALFKFLQDVAENTAGLEIMYETPGVKLIFDPETKEVFGVVAQDKSGNFLNIKAKRGVVMALGGFEGNKDMVTTYIKADIPIFPCGTPLNTGDGLVMLSEIGAKLRGFSSTEWGLHCCRKGSEETGAYLGFSWTNRKVWDGCIMVNDKGKRFVDEAGKADGDNTVKDGVRMAGKTTNIEDPSGTLRPIHTKGAIPELDFSMNEVRYVNSPMYLVTNQAKLDQGPLFVAAGKNGGNTWPNVKGVYTWSDDNKAEIAKGWLEKGETLEELAKKINVDPEGLVATVAKYNEDCAQGFDSEFGRDIALSPIDGGPYYATELGLGIINTQGGPARNGHHQVLDYNDKPIPRLYAGGEFGSIWIFLYQGGGNVPEALCTRAAGVEAANLEPWC